MARGFQINGESLVLVRFGDHIVGQPQPLSGQAVPSMDPNKSGEFAPGNPTALALFGNPVVSGISPYAASGSYTGTTSLFELGLAVDGIQVVPRPTHQDVRADDFGPDSPPDVLAMQAAVNINMNLINFDPQIAKICVGEATGGYGRSSADGEYFPGMLGSTGTPLGRGLPVKSSGNQLISVNVLSEFGFTPPQTAVQSGWRFRTCYLQDRVEIPLSSKRTKLYLSWRCIPYVPVRAPATNPYYYTEPLSSGVVLWDQTIDTF